MPAEIRLDHLVGALQDAEDELEKLARERAERTGEGYYDAYHVVAHSDRGRGLMRTIDDATALQTGRATSMDLEALATRR